MVLEAGQVGFSEGTAIWIVEVGGKVAKFTGAERA